MLLLAGCGTSPDDGSDRTPYQAVGSGEMLSATCPAPVDFEIPEDWGVEIMEGELQAGPFHIVCRLSAEDIGYYADISIYTAPSVAGDPAEILATYVQADDAHWPDRILTEVEEGEANGTPYASTSWYR